MSLAVANTGACGVRRGGPPAPPKVPPRLLVPGLGCLRELRFFLKINMGSGDLIPWPRGFNRGFMLALGTLIHAALCWGQPRGLLPWGPGSPRHPPPGTTPGLQPGAAMLFSQGVKGTLGTWCLAWLPRLVGVSGGDGGMGCPTPAATLPLPREMPRCAGKQNVSVLLLKDARRLKLFCKTSYRSRTPCRGPEPNPAQKVTV